MPYRGYYRGTFGRGDYRRGDPGILGNIFHGITGAIGGALGGLLTGNPLAAVGGAVKGAVSGVSRHDVLSAGPRGLTQQELDALHHRDNMLRAKVISTRPIGSSVVGTAHQGVLTSGARTMIGPGGGKRRRRMNWANPHALGRAERRIHSAVKHFTRYIRWVHPRKEGHAAPKFGHRRKK